MRDYTRRDAVKMFGATAGTAGLTGCLGGGSETEPEGNDSDNSGNSNSGNTNSGSGSSTNVEAERVNAWEDFEVTEEGKVEPLPFIAYDITHSQGNGAYRGHAHAPRDRVSVIRSWVAIDEEIKDFSEFDDIENIASTEPVVDNLVSDNRYRNTGPLGTMVMPKVNELEQIIVGFEVMRPENSSLEYPGGEYIITIDPENLADIPGEKQQYLDDLDNYVTGDGLLSQNYRDIV